MHYRCGKFWAKPKSEPNAETGFPSPIRKVSPLIKQAQYLPVQSLH